MNNIFYNSLPISRRYDLKGSTLGRTSGSKPKAGAILKDLDLDIRLKLEEGWHDRYVYDLDR
jgi:1-phosphatidylinositol-4-phosphate 5-kinase